MNVLDTFTGVLDVELLVAATLDLKAVSATGNRLFGTNFTVSVANSGN